MKPCEEPNAISSLSEKGQNQDLIPVLDVAPPLENDCLVL